MPTVQVSDEHFLIFRRWALLSFFWFVVAGCMGAFLRLQLFHPVADINYKYFLHGHSHLAFLGWVFNALFVCLLYAYIPAKVKRYRVLFWLLQVTVVGMLISFPLQGYAAVSITFSTLHIFLSYGFAYLFLKDVRKESQAHEKHRLSLSFARWSLFFMVLSSLGPYALGVVMARGLAGTPLYQLSIYFYLHFQYDGWFTFAVFGLFFWWLEKHKLAFSHTKGRYFLWMMVTACMPAYAISTLWTHPPVWVYLVAAFAALLQMIALVIFLRIMIPLRKQLKIVLGKGVLYLVLFAAMAFVLKTFMQFFSTLPAIADLGFTVRNFTIGYLHLIFLGLVTVFLVAYFSRQGFLHLHNQLSKVGIGLLLFGFAGSEIYLFLQPLFFMYGLGAIPAYFPSLLAFSLLMPLGAGLVLAAALKKHMEKRVEPSSILEVMSKNRNTISGNPVE
jgi:hypothetical protein